jgi:hypothetical protein
MTTDETKNGSSPSISSSVEDITPETAAEWLKLVAPSQRPLNARHVNRLADDMTSGRFLSNGDPIRFDWDGRLVDAQHRLAAAVKAGFTLRRIVVVRGLAPETITTIDTGSKARTASDVLKMRGAGKVPAGMTAAVTLEHFDFEYYPNSNATVPLKTRLWEELADVHKEQVTSLYQSLKAGRISNSYLLAAGLRCAMHDDQTYDFLQQAFANIPGVPPAGALLYNTALGMLKKKHFLKGPQAYQLSWCVFRAVQVFWNSEPLKQLRPPAHWPKEERTYDGFMRRGPRSVVVAAKELIQ